MDIKNNEKNIIAPNLFSVVEIIENNSATIAENWVKVRTVKSIFSARKISPKKFSDSYSVPIINYFVAVVREEKVAGDCPIMSKFVNFMITKGIVPKEVFDICMGFRRTLIAFLLKNNLVLKNPAPFMDEISNLFDANLSGVLDIFTTLYASNQKKIEIAKVQQNKLQQTLKIINSINTKILIIQDTRILLANQPFLEMAGVKDLKSLYLKYENGFGFFSDTDNFADDYKNDIGLWIEKVCKQNKPFQTNIYNEKLKKSFIYSVRITNLPMDNSTQYIMALSNISDHVKDEKMIEDFLTHDEITGFKNYPTFEKLVTKKTDEAKKEKSRLFLAIIDIPELRLINYEKGREAGDMVISGVAEDLRFLINDNIYLAHLEGSRFGILMDYETEQSSYDWCVELHKRMKQRDAVKTLAITEVDLAETTNQLFLRSYNLIEKANNLMDGTIVNDFTNVIEYKELDNQKKFTDRLAKTKQMDLSLFYMELPVVSNIKVLSVDANSAKLVLSYKQIKIAKIDMYVYFELEYIGNIKAHIVDVDVKNKIITIDEFVKDKTSPLNRKVYRIKAGDDVKAYITDNDRDYDVKVIDINTQYVAIEIDRKRNLDINSLVFIDILLPVANGFYSCKTNATITRVSKSPNGYKMVLLCHLDDSSADELSKYIAEQQIKIIKIIQG